MNLPVNKSRLYLLLLYLSISLLALYLLGTPPPPVLMLFVGALVLLVILTYEPLLRMIEQMTGFGASGDELAFFSAFVELNKMMHKYLEADDVLILVNSTLKEKIRTKKAVFLLNDVFKSPDALNAEIRRDEERRNHLVGWPDAGRQFEFLGREFVEEMLRAGKVRSRDDASAVLKSAFQETQTGLAIPIIQNRRLLCVILIGRSDNEAGWSEFEYQMFGYLANQLSIVLDRIRIYEQIMHKTAMDHAEKMQVMQSLSANIAHEMRTPLSGIRASITGIETYLPDLIRAYDEARVRDPESFPAIRENHLATLRVTPDRITLMIDQANAVIDMLLMNLRDSSLDRQQFSPCSAAECVRQAVERYPFKTGEREKVKLELEQDFRFLGVEILFIYIMFNLLKNALYSIRSAQKGEISVTLLRGDSLNRVLFRDTGEGIAEENLERIFEGFFTTKADGTGAGLAFCKRTVMSFGGEIECRSVKGEYAAFDISLPVLED